MKSVAYAKDALEQCAYLLEHPISLKQQLIAILSYEKVHQKTARPLRVSR
jgi:hypothetical protein